MERSKKAICYHSTLVLISYFKKIELKKILTFSYHVFIFILLTILTQVGGLIYLLSKALNKRISWPSKLKPVISFSVLYLLATFLILPNLAPFFGRERIQQTVTIHPSSYMTVLLNRNYVRPILNKVLSRVEAHLQGSGIQINYLDANFPFIDKFPLLPHLSHNDGKKLDISLVYETKEGHISSEVKSNSGYGTFEAPKVTEHNQIRQCLELGYFQYDYPKYLRFGTKNGDLKFSEKGTKKLVETLLKENDLGQLFIEPHLKTRLGLNHSKIRFHGCRAVRHDDHIHIQVK